MQKLLDGKDAEKDYLQKTWYIERYRVVVVDYVREVKDRFRPQRNTKARHRGTI